jgi:sialic acid synthase SpsE
MFISTGVSRLADIENALEWTDAAGLPREKICLLHCVTAYPAPPEDYNLRLMGNLADIFGCACGVSDHSLDPVLVPSLAASLGAAAIEKHLCLSRKDAGLDDPVALPPADFERMTIAVKMAAKSPIHGGDYRDRQIEAVLGDGVKRLAPSEAANYERTRRSLHALADIAAGEIIGETKFAILRTEKILRPGLPPDWAGKIVGKTAKQSIPAGEGIRLEDIV